MNIRKMFAFLLFAFLFIAGGIMPAQARESDGSRTRVALASGPKWASGVVRNGSEGDLAREVHLTYSRINRRGKVKARPDRSVQVTLAGGGSLRIEDLRVNRLYFVRGIDVASNETLLSEAYIVLPGQEGKTLLMTGIPAPVDPRIAQITALQETIEMLQQQLTDSDSQNNALAAQITRLQEQLDAGAGQASEAIMAQLAALQAQQATLISQNVALAAQVSALAQKISDLQQQLANGTPLAGPTVSVNPAFVNPTYVPGSSNVRLASFVVSVPTGSQLMFGSPVADKDLAPGLKLQNVYARVTDSVGIKNSSPKAVIGDEETNLAFSTSPVSVAGGGSAVIEFYGDILSNSTSGTYASAIDFKGWYAVDGNGAVIPFPGDGVKDQVAGQNITVASGPVLTISTSPNTAASQFAVMGSTSKSPVTVRLVADGTDDEQLTNLTVNDSISSGSTANTPSFINFTLWNGSTQVAGPTAMVMTSPSQGSVSFALTGGGVTVLKNSGIDLTVKSEVATWNSGGAFSGSVHRFSVAPGGVTVRPVNSSSTTTVVMGSALGNSMIVARSNITFATTTLGMTSGRTRQSVDDFARITATADSAGSARFLALQVMFVGGAASYAGGAPSLDLLDEETGNVVSANATWDTTRSAWVATVVPDYQLTAGQIRTWRYRTYSANFPNVASSLDTFEVSIIGGTWSDGSASFSFLASTLPMTVFVGSYE